ncbi:MAG: hypothetical protein IBJ18_00355 [Phycisphaerales bacterium]|nr:hypothetical protein [Phycisphaerales bacterium]
MQILKRAHLLAAFCGLSLAFTGAGLALQPGTPDEPPMHEPPPPPMGGPDDNNRPGPGDQQRPERRRGGQDSNDNRRPRMGGPNAQGPQGNAPGEGPMRQAMSNDPKVVRAALDLVRTHLKEMMPRIDKAITALDNGADVATVRRELAQSRAENAQGFMEALRQSGILGPGLMGNVRRGPGAGEGPDMQDDRDGPGPRGPEGEMREGREGREGRGPRAFTQEDRDRVLAEIREHNPDLAKQIESAREQSPESADQFLRFIGDKMRGMRELRDRDPESYQLRKTEIIGLFKMLKLRKEYAEAAKNNADQAKLDTIKGELRVVMGELWDTRQKLDEMQLRELEKRVERMKQEAVKRTEMREKVINERTEAIIREATQPPGGKGGRPPMRRDGAGPGPNGLPGPGGPRGGPGENAPPPPPVQPR